MSPPNLPTKEFFLPLKDLISLVKTAGGAWRFSPVTVKDVADGESMGGPFSACVWVVVLLNGRGRGGAAQR